MANAKFTKKISQSSVRAEEQDKLLNSIIETSLISIIGLNLNLDIIFFNKGSEKIFHFLSDEILNQPFATLCQHYVIGELEALFSKVYYQKRWQGEILLLKKNNVPFKAAVNIILQKADDEQPLGYTLILYELNTSQQAISSLQELNKDLIKNNVELIKNNEQLQKTNKFRKQFLDNMSHEFRTPLNCMMGFIELIYSGRLGELNTQQVEFLENTLICAKQLLFLVNDVLDLAKIESGKLEFHPRPVNFHHLLNETVEIFSSTLFKKNISIVTTVDPHLNKINLDLNKLKQVIYNLVSNAIQFSNFDNEIKITIQPYLQDWFKIEVSYAGLHKEKDLNTLFQFNSTPSTVTNLTHSSLSLVLVKEIVEAQGGEVGVSVKADQKNTFFAILPKSFSNEFAF